MDVVCGGLRGAAANKSRRAAYTRSVLKQWTASVAVAGAGGAAQLNAAAGAHYDSPPLSLSFGCPPHYYFLQDG